MSERHYRLLQIYNRTIGGGGEELATRQIVRVLSELTVFSECIFDSSDWKKPDAPQLWKQALLTFSNPTSAARIRQAQRDISAQAWIVHNFLPVLSGTVFSESIRQNVPIIQYIHNFRPFSISSYLWVGHHLDPGNWPINFLREIRYGAWQGSRLKTAFLGAVLASIHLRRQFRAVKAWVAVSKFMREKFVLAGVPSGSIFQIYNPWVLRSLEPAYGSGDYYLFLGRLIEEKGTKVVVRAWHELRAKYGGAAPRLIIGGDGPLADWVKEAAATNPSIEFKGYVAGEQKQRLLDGCKALVVPSLWWDPLPYVVYEAYDAGKPVLASSSGGLAEMVEQGLTGFRHPAGNITQLVNDVIEIDNRGELRRQMAINGRKWLAVNTNDEKWRSEFFKVVDHAIKGSTD